MRNDAMALVAALARQAGHDMVKQAQGLMGAPPAQPRPVGGLPMAQPMTQAAQPKPAMTGMMGGGMGGPAPKPQAAAKPPGSTPLM